MKFLGAYTGAFLLPLVRSMWIYAETDDPFAAYSFPAWTFALGCVTGFVIVDVARRLIRALQPAEEELHGMRDEQGPVGREESEK